jgi:hypothetical protein
MSRTFSLGSRRLLLGALALLLACLAIGATASADVTVTDCSQLQTKLNEAKEGEVITLAALCTESNSGAAKGSFELPPVANLTIQGLGGSPAGFDGTGASSFALEGVGDGLVLRNLVIENYTLAEKSAVRLYPSNGALPEIESDSFLNDSSTTSESSDAGGALYILAYSSACAYTGPLQITNSTFQGDSIDDTSTKGTLDQGGAVYAEIVCDTTSSPIHYATLTGNTFTGDSIKTSGKGEAFGGALFLGNGSQAEILMSATQTGNIFESDAIVGSAPHDVYGGGGEWAPSLDLSSTNDRFVDDSLPEPRGTAASSSGGGLGVITSICSEKATASAVLDNAVVAANTIGIPDEGGQSEGAGIYAGCEPVKPNGHFHLTLNDSTVSGNQAPEGVSGVDGEVADQLVLANSIVKGNSGNADIGGFEAGSSGSITSSFSDACVPSSSTALPGAGNLCVEPQLVDAASGDVHETSSSPTIDAGSNALVPEGLTKDFYGDTRIVSGRVGCYESVPAIVDMGAAEYFPGVPSCPARLPIQQQVPAPGITNFISIKTSRSTASLKMSCTSSDGVGCSGNIIVTAAENLKGKKIVAVSAATHRVPVRIAEASFAIAAGKTATVQVKLNATGRALLKKFHAIPSILIANEAIANNSSFLFLFRSVRFTEPKHKKKHKPKKHHKGSKHH